MTQPKSLSKQRKKSEAPEDYSGALFMCVGLVTTDDGKGNLGEVVINSTFHMPPDGNIRQNTLHQLRSVIATQAIEQHKIPEANISGIVFMNMFPLGVMSHNEFIGANNGSSRVQ